MAELEWKKSLCGICPAGCWVEAGMDADGRLADIRPSETRERLGWEWIVEAWLRQEATTGGLEVGLGDLPPPSSRVRPSKRGRKWRRFGASSDGATAND